MVLTEQQIRELRAILENLNTNINAGMGLDEIEMEAMQSILTRILGKK